MRTLYLMCGLAFAGKTTVAKAIVDNQNCAYVSLDDINRKRGLRFGGEGLPIEEWEKTHHIALARLEELMKSGHDIVLDDTNCFRRLRDRFRRLADRHGYETKVIYLDIPLDEIRRRMREKDETPERRVVKEHVFEILLQGFEPPEEDEVVLVFNQPNTLKNWLRTYFPLADENKKAK